MEIRITGPGDASFTFSLVESALVGRAVGCDLRLDDPQVSKRHARIWLEGARAWIEDLGSRNGTWIDGRRVEGPAPIPPDARLCVGPFSLEVCASEKGDAAEDPVELRRALIEEVIAALDPRRLEIENLPEEELRRRTDEAIARILAEAREAIPPSITVESLHREILDEVLGLGPLEALLADDSITEVMVNGPARIYVEREGRLELSPRVFSSERALLGAIERIAARVGRRIDEASPIVDARLPDGSRVCAIIPPLALCGPCLTIRKFRHDRLGLDDLVRRGTLSEPMRRFLELAVRARRNVVISGGTGSGKTDRKSVV